MPAIGMGLGWAGYTLALWGWCLLRGYNITLGELANPRTILNWQTAIQSQTPATQVMPGAAAAATGGSSGGDGGSSGSGPGGGIDGPGSSGGCPPGYYLIGGHCTQFAAD